MSTTSSLVVDNFQSLDNGSYVCQARDGMLTVNSSTLFLTGECGCETTVVITWLTQWWNMSDTLFVTNYFHDSLLGVGACFIPAE